MYLENLSTQKGVLKFSDGTLIQNGRIEFPAGQMNRVASINFAELFHDNTYSMLLTTSRNSNVCDKLYESDANGNTTREQSKCIVGCTAKDTKNIVYASYVAIGRWN